jgi:hypothetical protein
MQADSHRKDSTMRVYYGGNKRSGFHTRQEPFESLSINDADQRRYPFAKHTQRDLN